ncbi:MAG: response regulator [Candidatus Izimaplasma sp.]|nr:response regulator [Candidatus Izimaplasma bacterium]
MIHKIQNGIYHLSKSYEKERFRTNTYLLIEDDIGVLIEPGNLLDFEVIFKDIKTLIDPKQIIYIVLTHPDLDLSSSLPLFEKELDEYTLVTEWRTAEVLRFFKLENPYYLIKEHNLKLKLSAECTLQFISTPFAHYAGSFVIYDTKSQFLFSGDLFGSMSKNWSVYADDNYFEGMTLYHENYMPSSDFIKPVMKNLDKLTIKKILPQHGSIISDDLVKQSIHHLQDFTFFNSYSTVAAKKEKNLKYDYNVILAQMTKRLTALYDEKEIQDAFNETKITVSFNPIEVTSNLQDYDLWNKYFEIIYSKKGDEWLHYLESLVKRITTKYNIHKPTIYRSTLRELKQEKESVEKKSSKLKETIENIKKEERKDTVTGIYYDDILKDLLSESSKNKGGLLFIELDQTNKIRKHYDKKTNNTTLRTLSYLITNTFNDDQQVFRGEGSSFIIYFPKGNQDTLKEAARNIRNVVAESDQFIEDMTTGISIIDFKEESTDSIDELIHQGTIRRQLAHQSGYNTIVDYSTKETDIYDFQVLLVDEDEININMLTQYMKDEQINVITAKNPIEAIDILKEQKINLIISEINLSKLDGFSLKQLLNDTTDYNKLPFIMISHVKSKTILKRINDLNVDFFLQKPYYPVELIGIVKRMMRK